MPTTTISAPPRPPSASPPPGALRRWLEFHYARSGVAEYWLVKPHPYFVEVLRNGEGNFSTVQVCNEGGLLQSPAFPKLALNLGEIFAQLPTQPPQSLDQPKVK